MSEPRGRIVEDTALCRLSPERLFDLLVDPNERQKWDLCPPWIALEPVEAPPGPALEGARYTARGKARGIGFVGTAFVMASDRPHRYRIRSETKFERAFPDAASIEEYRIEPAGTGSRVHYTMTIVKTPGTGAFLTRLVSALLEPFVTARAAKRNFRETLGYAEKHAGMAT